MSTDQPALRLNGACGPRSGAPAVGVRWQYAMRWPHGPLASAEMTFADPVEAQAWARCWDTERLELVCRPVLTGRWRPLAEAKPGDATWRIDDLGDQL